MIEEDCNITPLPYKSYKPPPVQVHAQVETEVEARHSLPVCWLCPVQGSDDLLNSGTHLRQIARSMGRSLSKRGTHVRFFYLFFLSCSPPRSCPYWYTHPYPHPVLGLPCCPSSLSTHLQQIAQPLGSLLTKNGTHFRAFFMTFSPKLKCGPLNQ